MTKFCTSCGAALESDARFCVACAAPVKLAGAENALPGSAAPASTSTSAAKAPEPELSARPVDAGPPVHPKSRIGGTPLYVAGAVMAAIALGGGGYWGWTKKQEADAQARQIEEARIAEVKRKEEEAARREQELLQKLKDEEDRRQRAEQERLAAEARAAKEQQARRQAEANAAAEAQVRRQAEANAAADAHKRRQAEAQAAAEARVRRQAEANAAAAQELERQASAVAPSATGSTGYAAAVAAARRGDYRAAQAACLGPAQAGDGLCQGFMGLMYVNGQVGTRSNSDMQIAAQWFRRAANQNVAAAQFNLGLMYERGVGVPRNINTARTWYQRAAAQGNANARQALRRLANTRR